MSIVVQPEMTLVHGTTGAKMIAPVVLLDFDMSSRGPVNAVAAALRDTGNRALVLKVADPRENKRVLLTRIMTQAQDQFQEAPLLAAFGLAANLAMCLAGGAKNPLCGVLAISPFMGFDAPMFGCSRHNGTRFAENILRMSRMHMLSNTANYLECTSVLPGMRSPAAGPVSWGQLAACVPSASFAGLLAAIVCPTVIVLDDANEDLDQDRACHQIPAMNSRLGVSLQDLASVRPADVLQLAQSRLVS